MIIKLHDQPSIRRCNVIVNMHCCGWIQMDGWVPNDQCVTVLHTYEYKFGIGDETWTTTSSKAKRINSLTFQV